MDLGKKFVTLLNAVLKNAISPARPASAPADPQSQLTQLKQALTEVEAKEKEIAQLLKTTQDKAQTAAQTGNHTEAAAQQKLALELESHLTNQSTQAISLSQKLEQAEATLASVPPILQPEKTQSAAIGGKTDTPPPSTAKREQKSASPSANLPENPDLAARKSRLSD